MLLSVAHLHARHNQYPAYRAVHTMRACTYYARRIHVHDHVTSRKPPGVINLSHSGGLRAIVRGQGRLRAACEAAEEGWGTMCDAIGAAKVMTSRWGLDDDTGEGEIAVTAALRQRPPAEN